MRILGAHQRRRVPACLTILLASSQKKATNVTVTKSLIDEARAEKINLSATLEQALERQLSQRRRERWLRENREATENCNRLADAHGLFADRHRVF